MDPSTSLNRSDSYSSIAPPRNPPTPGRALKKCSSPRERTREQGLPLRGGRPSKEVLVKYTISSQKVRILRHSPASPRADDPRTELMDEMSEAFKNPLRMMLMMAAMAGGLPGSSRAGRNGTYRLLPIASPRELPS